FFSSRRRHTRFSRDWSSDVCSSDLGLVLDTDVMRFEEGSKLYGINYKLAYSPQGETGHYELPALPAMGLLGMTAREAGEKLEAVNRALCDTLPRRKRDVMALRIP